MQVSVSTLPRLALNLAVARTLGLDMEWSDHFGEFIEVDKLDKLAHIRLPDYCAGGEHLMQMVSLFTIELTPAITQGELTGWHATSHGHQHNPAVSAQGHGRDEDPAIAIIRCFLDCAHGETMDLPEEALAGLPLEAEDLSSLL